MFYVKSLKKVLVILGNCFESKKEREKIILLTVIYILKNWSKSCDIIYWYIWSFLSCIFVPQRFFFLILSRRKSLNEFHWPNRSVFWLSSFSFFCFTSQHPQDLHTLLSNTLTLGLISSMNERSKYENNARETKMES